MSIALLSGDIAKVSSNIFDVPQRPLSDSSHGCQQVLDLAADEDTWLVTHLSDLFAKLGLLRDSRPV